jgi:hypothetical protein
MAWTTPETAVAGEVLTAAYLNTNVRDNSIMGGPVYTNEAARDAAITSPSEGMRVYLTAPTIPAAVGTTQFVPSGILTIYNGTVWVCVTEVGSQTPGGSAAFTTSYADVTVGGVATSVTLVTGTTALISFSARSVGNGNFANLSVKTATVAASANWAAYNQTSAYVTIGRTCVMSGLTAGTNTFTLQAQNNVAGGSCDQIQLAVKGIA